jgi:phosphoglycolate phosphatase-like HAD superfamily hydrolase
MRKLGKVAAALEHFYGQLYSVHVAFGHPDARSERYHDETRAKPNGTMLLEAMRGHRVDSDACVYVGDSRSDETAAGRAGVRYIDQAEFFPAPQIAREKPLFQGSRPD